MANRRSAPPVGVGHSSSIAQSDAIAAGPDAGHPGAEEQVIVAPDDQVSIPAAFQPAGPNVKLSDQEKVQQDRLQQEFVDTIRQPDGSTPPSPKEWQTAQEKSDERFRMLFGYQAFLQRQIQANLNSQ